MDDLLELIEMDAEEPELIPEILPIDVRISVVGPVSAFIEMFTAAVAITPIKEILPNTSFVKMEAFDSTSSAVSYAQVSATDGDRSLVVVNDSISVKLAGSALLPGKKMLEILKLAPSDTVRIDVAGSTATIKADRAVWTVSTPTGDALPPLPDIESITTYPVDRKAFIRALETVVRATAKSSARLSLMQARISKNKITACDGARVHQAEIADLPKTLTTTLPSDLIETAIREMKTFDEDILLFGASKSTVVFQMGRNVLTGQRLTLEYPDVEHLMLEPAMLNTDLLTVSVKDLAETVKRVRVNSDPDYLAIALTVREIKGQWTLAVRSRDKAGNASQEILPVTYDGSEEVTEVILNHKYLTEILEAVTSDMITFKLGKSTKTKKSPLYVADGTFVGVLQQMSANLVM